MKTLKEQIAPHAQYWDCYNDCPLEYNHNGKLEKIADNYAIEFVQWLFHIDKDILKKQLKHFKKEKGL